MAYKVVLTQNFEVTASQTSRWLLKTWSYKSALNFQKRLLIVIGMISRNPTIGRPSTKKQNIRSVLVTKHNRLYYTFADDVVTILELFETKQNPRRNKFD